MTLYCARAIYNTKKYRTVIIFVGILARNQETRFIPISDLMKDLNVYKKDSIKLSKSLFKYQQCSVSNRLDAFQSNKTITYNATNGHKTINSHHSF